MARSAGLVVSASVWLLVACGGTDGIAADVDAAQPPRTPRAGALTDGGSAPPAILTDGGSADATIADGPPASDLAGALEALTAKCNVASNGKYATDMGEPGTIDICRLKGAFFWKADMDVDCDGQSTSECSKDTDPDYQSQTSFTQASDGKPLIASKLPYVVIPLPSSRFRSDNEGIEPGALVVVVYQGKVAYGVFGDQGPDKIIGEASYAMAKSLGINPNPASGGVDSGVTYIVFTGKNAVVRPIEDHDEAATLGAKLVEWLQKNN